MESVVNRGKRAGFFTSSISLKLMAVFLCVTIPMLVVGLLVFRLGEGRQRQALLESLNSQLDFYQLRFDSEYERVARLQLALATDADLNSLADLSANMDDFTRTMTVRRLQERLRDILEDNGYVENISAYITSLGAVVSAPGPGRFVYDGLHGHPIEMENSQGGFTVFQPAQLTLLLASARSAQDGQQLYTIEIELSKSRFTRDMEEISSTLPGGLVLFHTASGQVLAGTGEESSQAAVAAAFAAIQPEEGGATLRLAEGEYGGTSWLVASRETSVPGVLALAYADEAAFLQPLRVYTQWVWLMVVVFLAVTLVYAALVHRSINRPVSLLLAHFKRLEQGDMQTRIPVESLQKNDEFGALYRQFNGTVERLDTAIIQNYQEKILAQRAQLKQLHAQINPHFLYNSYFLLHRLVKQEDPFAVEFSRFLGEYFRYITKNDEELVPLSEEVAHAVLYANIQAARFAERIKVHFGSLPKGVEQLAVPRLILQPILENAYLHGLENVEEGGVLWVEFMVEDGALLVLVTNNGGPMDAAALERLMCEAEAGVSTQETSGLVNIHRRLRLAFGGRSGLEFYNLVDGVQVRVRVEGPASREGTG